MYMEAYSLLVNSKKFIGNQPVSLSKKSFIKEHEYYLTKKLDGKRYIIFINDGYIYRINTKNTIEKIETKIKISSQYSGIILDSEFYKGKYHVFDILFFKNKDIRNLNLNDRIPLLIEILDGINSYKFVIKKHYKANKLCEFTKKFIEKHKKNFKDGILDGIILTPNVNYYGKIYKYKPIDLLSIDFKIKKVHGDTFLLLLQNNTIFSTKNNKNIGKVKVSKRSPKSAPKQHLTRACVWTKLISNSWAYC